MNKILHHKAAYAPGRIVLTSDRVFSNVYEFSSRSLTMIISFYFTITTLQEEHSLLIGPNIVL